MAANGEREPETPTSLPDRWTEGTAASNGIGIHYTRTGGDGPPLVIAHGVFDDGPCRTPLARDLEGDYDVVTVDARGHGRSDAPETGYDVENRVADLVGVVEALGPERPILLGHSMGGDTVAATAPRHPDLPRAVVMEDSGAMLGGSSDDDGVPDRARGRIERWGTHTKAELLETDEELIGHREAGDEDPASLPADARVRVSPATAAVFERPAVNPRGDLPRRYFSITSSRG